MEPEKKNLHFQIQQLRHIRSEVSQCQQRMRQIREELQVLEEEEQSSFAQLSDRLDQQQHRVLCEVQDQHSARVQQIQEQLEQDLDACHRRFSQHLGQQSAQYQQECSASQAQLEGELWVLRSVCDESRDDSPTSEAARAREKLENRESTIRQRQQDLKDRLALQHDYLKSCHARVDPELPAASVSAPSSEVAREKIHSLLDDSFELSGEIDAMNLPQWVQGMRVLLIPLLSFVCIVIPVTLVRADLQSYLDPSRGEPDWEWLGVSALIGAAVSFLFTLVTVLTVQGRLRRRVEEMKQNAADIAALQEYWNKQSWKQQLVLEERAEKWLSELEQSRERKAARMTEETEQQLAVLRQQHEERVRQLTSEEQQQLQLLEESASEAVCEAEEHRDRQFAEIRGETSQHAAAESEELQKQGGVRRQALLQELAKLRSECESHLGAARLIAAAASEERLPTAFSEGSRWEPPSVLPSVIEAGRLTVGFPARPESPDSELLQFEMPGLLQFPRDLSLVVRHDAAGRETAVDFLRVMLLRILTTMIPGRVQFTLIDPIGLGQSFSAMMHLADFDELMIGNRIWTESGQIRERLQKVTEHMENVFQTYLRSEYETIEEYNAAAGEVAEPFHFVVIAGFPAGFTEEAARHLTSILTSGPRCGVHALIAWSPEQPVPRSFSPDDLAASCAGFSVVSGRVIPDVLLNAETTPMPGEVQWSPAVSPESSVYVEQVRAVGDQSRDARRVEVSFSRIAPQPREIWTQSSASGIDLPVGRAGAARLQYLRLGRGTSQHVLIAGKTGSGKSTLMHILVTNLALMYSPEEVRFCLVDFKKGVEFRAYSSCRLPHADVIAIESDREFGLSVLERLDRVLQERGELYRARGVQDVAAFRRQYPDEPLPRLVLLIDEFQEFFTIEDRVSSQAALLLDRLIRQGRAFGMHVILGSQTLGGAYSLARSTLGQVAVRIALQCSESDAHLILSEDNSAARLLTRPGEAIYNDANGLVEGNHLFQVAWLEDAQRDGLLMPLQQRADEAGFTLRPPIVFEGNTPPRLEACEQLAAWWQAGCPEVAERLPLWLGAPVAIADPVQLNFESSAGRNLLIVGQESEAADAILGSVLVSCGAAAEHAEAILLHDGRDSKSTEQLQTLAEAFSTGVRRSAVAEADSLIGELAEELAVRENDSVSPHRRRVLLCIRNLGLFGSLRRREDDFGFGGFGTEKEPETSDHFADLVRRGPQVGIHVIIWADSFSNVTRWLSGAMLKEFDTRVAFRLNQTDSASLIDTAAAAHNGPGRAIIYRDQTGEATRFRPWQMPDADRVAAVGGSSASPEAGSVDQVNELVEPGEMPDIDDLIIE